MIFVARTRMLKVPRVLVGSEQQFERHISLANPDGFATWAEALADITEFDADAFTCWSVTVGATKLDDTFLVLFDKPTSHPHYVPST